MRLELKSISVWSVVKIAFIFNLVGGLVYGLFSALFMGSILSLMSGSGIFPIDEYSDSDFSVGALIIFMPLFSAAVAVFFGTICAVVLAVLYNLTSGILGGLEFEFQPTDRSDLSFAASATEPTPSSVSTPRVPPTLSVHPTSSVLAPPPPPPPPPASDPAPKQPPPADDSDSADKSEPPATV